MTQAPASENRFRLLFERSSDPMLLLDATTFRFIDCNAAAVEIIRCREKEQLLGIAPWEISPERQPDGRLSAEKAAEILERAINNGTERFEWVHRRMDGTDVSVEIVLTSLELAGRSVVFMIWREITGRQRMEASLRESEAKFRLLFENSPDCVMLFDVAHTKFFDCNGAALKLLRCDRDWLVGKHPWEIAPPYQPCGTPSKEKAAGIVQRAINGGPLTFEWEHGRGDGTHFPAHISVTTISLGSREIWFSVVRDITESKRAAAEAAELRTSLERRVEERTSELERANAQLRETEQQLLKALAAEKELNELKTSFVSMVSHEFRTPLGVIMVASEVLQRYFPRLSTEQRNEHLDSILSSVRRMSGMMEDVLLLSRVDAGRMDFRPAELNLRIFCGRIVDEVHSATNHTSPVKFSCAADLPAIASGDESLLRHIITNLLSNAVKYSAPGSPVRLNIRREDDCAVFEISDKGIGIPAADLERLFQTFHRGRNVGQVNGTGLGLVIVKRCCDLHGGSISVQSQEGQGTTFTVRLPMFEQTE